MGETAREKVKKGVELMDPLSAPLGALQRAQVTPLQPLVLWSCRVSKVPAPGGSPAVPEEFLPASQQQASSTRTKHLRFNCLTISSPLQAKRGLSYLQPRGEEKEGERKM